MKDLKEIIETLRNLKDEIRKKYKAEILRVFGSFVRGEQKEGSDVDVLVKFYEGATLFDFVGLSIFLEEKLGVKVDIVPQDVIRVELKERIMKEAIKV